MKSLNTVVWCWVLVAGSCISLLPAGATAASGDELQWSITPYIWAPKTSLDLSFRDSNVGSGSISFGDLMDMMDSAFMINAEAGKGHWSGFVDLTYLEISDRDKRTLVRVDSSSKQVFLDAAVAYWPGGPGSNLSLYGGLRYTELDDQFKFKRVSDGTLLGKTRSDKTYSDALLGVRYRWDLSKRWMFLAQGDGSFGSSEGTWMLRGLLGYTVGKREMNRIIVGYQYKQADFKDGDVGLDFTYNGPVAGFNFRF